MGSALGVAKTAAAKIGCTVDEWIARRANGERWCTTCRAWQPLESMHTDRSRPGGIGSTCRACTAVMFAARKKAARSRARVVCRYDRRPHRIDAECEDATVVPRNGTGGAR